MEGYSEGTQGGERSAQVAQIRMDDFLETATLAVLRALEKAGLNPQPEPPGFSPLNPQPLPPFDITVGLILSTREGTSVLRGSQI